MTTERTPAGRRRIALVASNPATSKETGWPIGFWWAELSHPWWEFAAAGYDVDIVSPEGGDLEADEWSDPRHESGYSADDVLSLGFINSPVHAALISATPDLSDVTPTRYDAVFFVGGQAPMYTFVDDERVHATMRAFIEADRVTAAICHATSALLRARGSDDRLLVEGRTWTGFANAEERFADEAVGRRIQPFWIEDEARGIADTNFIVHGAFASHAVRDGKLVTGQQQHSGAAAARLVIDALGR